MARQVPATDVMLTLVASPHRDDTVTHVLRTVVALLENGRKVGVWACGYATTLTSGGLGASKPRDLASWDTDYPSTPLHARRTRAPCARAPRSARTAP